MKARHTARELAVKILYKVDVSDAWKNPLGNGVLDAAFDGGIDKAASKKSSGKPAHAAKEYAEKLILGVVERLGEIDSLIESCSDNWTLDRMPVVDRNVLRVAVYEMVCSAELTPYRVVIDEAVEIAKSYGSEQSGAFVNGILDKVKKDALN
jgi:N utilization substance protein B